MIFSVSFYWDIWTSIHSILNVYFFFLLKNDLVEKEIKNHSKPAAGAFRKIGIGVTGVITLPLAFLE